MAKARYKTLKLNEISSVDNPAQVGARALIMKRNDPLLRDILKYVETPVGAQTFAEILVEEEARERQWKANQALYPVFDALSASIRSIIADSGVDMAAKQTKITASVTQFLAAVREKAPEAEAELSKVMKGLASGEIKPARKGETMPGENEDVKALKTSVEALTTQVNALTAQNADLQIDAGLNDADKEHIKTLADADAVKAFKKRAPQERAQIIAAKAAGDESIEVDGRKIQKSVVGDTVFSVMKSQQKQITENAEALKRANEQTETVELKKRAGDDLSHLPGKEEDKVALLRAAKSMPENARTTLDAILTAADKMAAKGFDRIGAEDGSGRDVAKAAQVFDEKVTMIAKRDNIPRSKAMSKARTEFAAEYEASQEASNVEYIAPKKAAR